MEYYRIGAIKPITPLKIFEATEIQDCFRYMQKGQHIGKIIVKMPENAEELPVSAISEDLILRSDVCYLLVGGLGGIGQAISTWMVEKGARNLVFLSRSAGKSADGAKFVSELVSLGCSVQVIPGSVSNIDDVRNVVNEARKPIAGVIQASMVLQV
jgi:KR domain